MRRRFICVAATVLGLSAAGYGQWASGFNVDGGFDGMVEFQNGNPAKDLFDPSGASGGRLLVQTQDGFDYGGAHDKGGRSLGGDKNPNVDSVSAYFKFNWAQLAETAADVGSAVDFLGDTQVHISREAMGSLMRFRKTGADYEVNLGAHMGGVGISYHGYKAGDSFINLGPNAVGQEMQLVISYDAPTRVLHIQLFDINGVSLGSNIGDLDTDFGSLSTFGGPATLTAELNATRFKYLGWQDYLWNVNQQTILWDVDRVAYYTTATGAFGAVIPEPVTALLLALSLTPLVSRRRGRA